MPLSNSTEDAPCSGKNTQGDAYRPDISVLKFPFLTRSPAIAGAEDTALDATSRVELEIQSSIDDNGISELMAADEVNHVLSIEEEVVAMDWDQALLCGTEFAVSEPRGSRHEGMLKLKRSVLT